MQSKLFFKTENDALDTTTKKLRDYYAPIISKKNTLSKQRAKVEIWICLMMI